MSAAVKPRTCGECRQWHELAAYNERGDRDNCSPRGTRWHLEIAAEHKACRTPHAVSRVGDDGQGALL